MAELERFTVDELVELGARLRELGADAPSMVAVASEVVEVLHTTLRAGDGSPACTSIRLLKTHRFGDLPPSAREAAAVPAGAITPATTALTTLAWAGSARMPAVWSALPLADEASVLASPFLHAVLRTLHIMPSELLAPAAAQESELHRRPYGVFHLEDATAPDAPLSPEGGRCIAATGTRSIVALGAGLLSGDVFLLILCSKVPVDRRVAKLLKTLTPAVKTALVPMTFTVFGGRRGLAPSG